MSLTQVFTYRGQDIETFLRGGNTEKRIFQRRTDIEDTIGDSIRVSQLFGAKWRNVQEARKRWEW